MKGNMDANMHGTVLIVDDEENLGLFLQRLIIAEGFDAHVATSAETARASAGKLYPDIFLLDIRLPDANGVELMQELREEYPSAQFIMMTAHGSIRTAVQSTRFGAFEYFTKPIEPDELTVSLKNAMKTRRLAEEVEHLRRKTRIHSGMIDVSFQRFPSPAMRKVVDKVSRAAESDVSILLTGESGTGKNFLARWIHSISPRAAGPFFDINCASITPSLVESELFGHEPGAFTGSRGRKRGLLELAGGGTLLLDEIGDMAVELQARLLTFMDTQTLRRVGGETNIKVDARIISATNQDLENLVEEGRFRRDLFYRLNVLAVRMPPLRERKEDIPILASETLARLTHNMDWKQAPALSPEAERQLMDYDWPGNVRELRNVLERTMFESGDKSVITHINLMKTAHLALRLESISADAPTGELALGFPAENFVMKDALNELTKKLVVKAIELTKTKKEASELLGITRHSLAHYIKTYNLDA